MAPTIVVCGHGPGISDAVARRFGKEGFSVAIVARNEERLRASAESLKAAGVTAQAFATDLADAQAVRRTIQGVRDELGPIEIIHYNAYGGGAGDLATAPTAELRAVFDIAVVGLVTAVQAALPDLEVHKGSVLVTGGGFAYYEPKIDQMAAQFGAMGLAIGKAAQHKATGILHEALGKRGIYVGEVVVLGMVKGTAFDSGNATIEPSAVAERFWELHRERSVRTVDFA
jgi:NADP-dependent 3-hydroxy acid dehydrogenase YdfG